uniref:ELM2 domain-containing protein n=1 Tax=Heterorhabditis bacteriophora TaxID=37862 RepID=A0A1I7X8U1_HETBA
MEIDDSVLDETVDGLLEGDVDDSTLDRDPDVPSEESSSPSDSGRVEMKIDDESNDTLDTAVSGDAKKDGKGGIASHKEEDRDEEVEDEHKTMLTSADRKIQVGDEFQAKVDEPQKDQEETIMSDDDDRDQIMWRAPSRGFDEQRLMEYCEDAIGVYKLTYDRALFILQNCQYNVDRALEKIKKRRLIVEEWGDDDRILFKQAFHMFGKNFSKIRQTMPHRSMASIIQFYYNTKKEHDYKSLLDSKLADDSDEGGG